MNTSSLLIEKDGPFATLLTLNRPEKRNALSMDLMKELCGAIEDAGRDKTRRVIVIKGAGDAFCAGLDLKEASDSKNATVSARMVARMLLTVSQTPLITIAAVHGAAVAGGAGLMSACDFVVAASGTKIGYPEVRRGLVAALVMTFLRRHLRERDIRELLLTGELITAERALAMGLVNRVAAPSEVMQEARKLAASVVQGGPLAVTRTKQILDGSWPNSVKQDLQRALKHHLKARHSAEAEEGITAFLEKRHPRWVSPLPSD